MVVQRVGVILNMDGTLFQTHRVLPDALGKTFDWLRREGEWIDETPTRRFFTMIGAPMDEVWRALLPDHKESVRQEVDHQFQQFLCRSVEKGLGALYPGVPDVLHALWQQQVPLFIASHGSCSYVDAILRKHQLLPYFEDVYAAGRGDALSKTEHVANLRQSYGLQEGILVGDRGCDVEAGLLNGFATVGCRYGYANDPLELVEADVPLFRFWDLPEVVQRLLPAELGRSYG